MAENIEDRRAKREQFLEIVYDLKNGTPGKYANFRQILSPLGVEYNEYRDLAHYLHETGYVDAQGMNSSAVALTVQGVSHVEERKEKSGMIERDIREHGQALTISRGGEIITQLVGVKVPGKGRFVFRPGEDVRTNDEIRTTAGDAYYVLDVDDVPREGLIAHFETQAQRNQRLAASRPSTTNINMGDAYGSNINTGTQYDVQMDTGFDFRSIEQQIDQRGGADAEELRQALTEIRASLEQDGSLRRGTLARFGGAIRDNAWFTSHVGKEIVEWMARAGGA